MAEPIEGAYFNWLCAKVLDFDVRTHVELMRILYSTEFVWVVPGDRNREEDGFELRIYFLSEAFRKDEPGWRDSPCSVLEMLIAFAGRMSFQTEMSTKQWFWIFLNNLGLDDYHQVTSKRDRMHIDEVLHTFVWRTYRRDGSGGGLFPMRDPESDQRHVEVWFQGCAYLVDQCIM